MDRRILGILLVLVGVSLSRSGAASSAFPEVVRETLGARSAPPCTVCHTSPSGGIGTANTSFGTYLRSRGLQAGDDTSLLTALRAAEGEKHDSNGDGKPDTEALRAGEDPNLPSTSEEPQEPRSYGCGAQVSPQSLGADASYLAVLAVAVVGLVCRRRRPH